MERHPVQESPPLPIEDRVRLLEHHLARLWDEVWWVTLPWYKRMYWRLQGFRAPIAHFYEECD